MVWIYCKTTDDPKKVGEYICKSNFNQDTRTKNPPVLKDEGEDDCWIIKTHSDDKASAMIYRIRHDVLVIEIDEECVVNVLEPLMTRYGFDNLKWLLTK